MRLGIKRYFTSLVLASVATAFVFALFGIGVDGVIDKVTTTIISFSFALILDATVKDYYCYRRRMVLKYWGGRALEVLTVMAFVGASLTTTWLNMFLALSGTLALGCGVYLYDKYVFNIIEFSEDGLAETQKENVQKYGGKGEIRKMAKLVKRFPKLTSREREALLCKHLRCRFIDDSIEKGIDIGSPFDSDSLATYDELVARGEEKKEDAEEVLAYIKVCLSNYEAKENESTQKENA